MSEKHNPRVYQPKTRRVLDDHGNFTPFSEDMEASEKAYAAAGTTREEVEAERAEKRMFSRNLNTKQGQKSAVTMLSDEALEKELARRGKISGKVSKPVVEKPYNTEMPKPRAVAGLKEDHEESDPSEFSELTVAELKAKLDEMGAKYPPSARKSKLIALLENDGMPTDAGNVD